MADDPLANETSVSAELTANGFKASAKSRLLSAIDRLGGNVVDLLNAPLESLTKEKRAKTDTRIKAIEAIGELGIERLKTDPEFAERAMRNHYETILTKQDNKDAVAQSALEDLRRQPPTDEQANSGTEKLDESFMARFEKYAEEASAADIREKWGRVLAAQVRNPNSFSLKVLRIIDELEPVTAKLFERICENRITNFIPKPLLDALSVSEVAQLTTAGLLIEPGIGQHIEARDVADQDGVGLWLWIFDDRALGATKTQISSKGKSDRRTFEVVKFRPVLPTYILSDAGRSISSILPHDEIAVCRRLGVELSTSFPKSEVRIFKKELDGTFAGIELFPAIDVDEGTAVVG